MSGSSTGDHEQFLIGPIAKALDDYERGDLGLARLVVDFEAGIEVLFDVADNDWWRSFARRGLVWRSTRSFCMTAALR